LLGCQAELIHRLLHHLETLHGFRVGLATAATISPTIAWSLSAVSSITVIAGRILKAKGRCSGISASATTSKKAAETASLASRSATLARISSTLARIASTLAGRATAQTTAAATRSAAVLSAPLRAELVSQLTRAFLIRLIQALDFRLLGVVELQLFLDCGVVRKIQKRREATTTSAKTTAAKPPAGATAGTTALTRALRPKIQAKDRHPHHQGCRDEAQS
jgi:hypothetical protein